MKREELIAYYEKQLEAVKQVWSDGRDGLGNEGSAYIEFAEKQLEAVKNGREW